MGGATRISFIDDPHLLTKEGLDDEVDGDQEQEAGTDEQERPVAPSVCGYMPTLHDELHACKVQDELDA